MGARHEGLCGIVAMLLALINSAGPGILASLHLSGGFPMGSVKAALSTFHLLTVCVFLLALLGSAFGDEETILHQFNAPGDGVEPYSALVVDKAGNLFGTTTLGGSGTNCDFGNSCGTVFEVSPPTVSGGSWTETIVYNFLGGADGETPLSDLVFDQAGNLYGTTHAGGLLNCVVGSTMVGCGTVFELSPPTQAGGNWTETVLYRFTGGADGAGPEAKLTFDSKGNLYSTTEYGGDMTCSEPITSNLAGCGTVFELSPPATTNTGWTESTLYAFRGMNDGATPLGGGLTFDSTGSLYGTTSSGGGTSSYCLALPCGTVFELSPPATQGGSWTEATLYAFQWVSRTDPTQPNGGLVLRNGSIFGTTVYGGQYVAGVAFQLKKASNGNWGLTILHNFDESNLDGFGPNPGLVADTHGDLYGTTEAGGVFWCNTVGCGSVFKLIPPSTSGGTWKETILHAFRGVSDGVFPSPE